MFSLPSKAKSLEIAVKTYAKTDALFLFYKNSFDKNHEAENRPKIKNFVRNTPGSISRDL